jgi:hypothetical protein
MHIVAATRQSIRAPIDVVWRVMTDLRAYREWNPFIVDIDTPPGEATVGQAMKLTIRWKSGLTVSSPEEISVLDAPAERSDGVRRATMEYVFRGLVDRLNIVRGRRVQTLEAESDGTTIYRTEERFTGLLAVAVPIEAVQDGFERHARALAARAESLHHAAR